MFRWACVCAVVVAASAMAETGSRITYERTIAPAHSLGNVEDVVITYAVGDTEKIATFVDVFVEQTSRAETLRVIDATRLEHSDERSHRWKKRPKYVERHYKADAYLRIESFRCETKERSGEVGGYDVDGNRIRRTQRWYDATCEAHLHALANPSNERLTEFTVRGEGTSPRVDALTNEERDIAMDQAARYAAIQAAEQITPRRVRESISLIEEAPQFDNGMSMIDAGRLVEARQMWERALTGHGTSAPLHFNIAAVCEALGDLRAANDHYTTALKLASGESRYRYEYEMFRRRTGWKR